MDDNPSQRRPRSANELFWAFTLMALQGFGGVLAVVQRELVERRRWLTNEQFVEEWSVAQVMPGPNVINLALIFGERCFGWRGAVAATAGLLLFPLLVVLGLMVSYGMVAQTGWAQGALRGMGAAAAGLIAATGLKLASALKTNVIGTRVCLLLVVLGFVGVGLMRWPLAWVLIGLGIPSMAWAYVCLSRTIHTGATTKPPAP